MILPVAEINPLVTKLPPVTVPNATIAADVILPEKFAPAAVKLPPATMSPEDVIGPAIIGPGVSIPPDPLS